MIVHFSNFFLSNSQNEPLTPITGTYAYMAPEVLLGATNYSRKVDIWSAGCIMAELFLLEGLFVGRSSIATVSDALLLISVFSGCSAGEVVGNVIKLIS